MTSPVPRGWDRGANPRCPTATNTLLPSPLGFCRSPPVMVAGGRVFVLPCIQQIQRISLNTLTLNVKSEKVYTRHGVPISVTGIAQVTASPAASPVCMAKAQRDYELKKAAYDIEVNTRKAESDLAYQLQVRRPPRGGGRAPPMPVRHRNLVGPVVADEISKPLTEVKKITMVSSGGGEVGAAKLTGEVLDIMTKLPDAVEKLTGVSISQMGRKKPGRMS
nr:flotillin-1 [Pelodiscus sinensis]|eukprot:XP_025041400.1 flotillin-1 [Pelodiscus sinensis]